MGLLSNIGKSIRKTISNIKASSVILKSPVAKVLNVTTVAIAHPVQTIKAVVSPKTTVKKVIRKHFSKPLKEQIKDIALGTVGIGTTVVGGAITATAAKAGTLLPALIPTTLKGKVIAGLAAPVIIGAVAKEPLGALEAIASAPSQLGQFGGDVGSFIVEPSFAAAKKIVTKSPILSAAAGALAVGGLVKGVAPMISGVLQKEAIQEQTKAIREAGGKIPTTAPTAPTAPITPATERLVTTAVTKSSTKRKRRSIKVPTQNISQRVNVVVANKSTSTGLRTTNKYLKRELLINRWA